MHAERLINVDQNCCSVNFKLKLSKIRRIELCYSRFINGHLETIALFDVSSFILIPPIINENFMSIEFSVSIDYLFNIHWYLHIAGLR